MYLAATQIRFEVGPSYVLATQIPMVPLLFMAPLGMVPALVGAAMFVGAGLGIVHGRLPVDRLLSSLAFSWHVMGPVLVMAFAGAPRPTLSDWPLYAAAFGAQALVESVVDSTVQLARAPHTDARDYVLALGAGLLVDGLMFPVGLLAVVAADATGRPVWALATIPAIGLLALIDWERRRRIASARAHAHALQLERERSKHALAGLGEAIASPLSADSLMSLAARSAKEALSADLVVLPDGPQRHIVESDGLWRFVDDLRDLCRDAGGVMVGRSGDHFGAAAPVAGHSTDLAMVCIRRHSAFSAEEQQRLHTLSAQLTAGLQRAELQEVLQRQAQTDHLTGLANHRRFQEVLASTLQESAGRSVSLALIDLDHFKRVNDTFGHQAGDLVLRSVAEVLRGACRETDTPARYGGEELVVVLPHTDPADALALAERLRSSIEAMTVRSTDGQWVPVTASIGVATTTGSGAAESLIAAADAALYAAKSGGRNRIVVAGWDEQPADQAGIAAAGGRAS